MERLKEEQIEAFWEGAKDVEKLLKGKLVVLISAGSHNDKLFEFMRSKLRLICELWSADDVRQNAGSSAYGDAMRRADIMILLPALAGHERPGIPTKALNMLDSPTGYEQSGGIPGTMAKPSEYGRDKTVVVGDAENINPKYLNVRGGVCDPLDLNAGKEFLNGVKAVINRNFS